MPANRENNHQRLNIQSLACSAEFGIVGVSGIVGMLGAIFFGSLALPDISAVSPSNSSSTISTQLVNGIAVRILDSTATSEISKLDLALAATPSGAFTKNSMNAEVSTPNPGGYKLYMSSNYLDPTTQNPTHTTALVNTEAANYTIPSLDSNDVSETDFSRSGGSYVNRWGYSIDGNSSYNSIPAYGAPATIKTTSAQADRSLTEVTIGVNVDLSRAAGSYKNTLVFSAVANPALTTYTLSFNLDGGSAPVSNPNAFNDMTISEVSAQHTFAIPNIAPEKSGHYVFQYWTDSNNNHYNPGDTITIIGNEEYVGSETLTAHWELMGKTIADSTSLQEVEICPDTLATGVQYTLVDAGEPSKSYTVAKLADGRCWMTQNYNVSGGKTLTPEYYNVPPSDCNITDSGCVLPASSTSGFSWEHVAYVYNNATYGGYYTWKAATAGTDPDSGIAPYDICPKGWKLPNASEFSKFVNSYSVSELVQSPINIAYGGFFNSYTPWQGQDGYGRYWSSNAGSTTSARALHIDPSQKRFIDYSRGFGFSMRCVFAE